MRLTTTSAVWDWQSRTAPLRCIMARCGRRMQILACEFFVSSRWIMHRSQPMKGRQSRKAFQQINRFTLPDDMKQSELVHNSDSVDAEAETGHQPYDCDRGVRPVDSGSCSGTPSFVAIFVHPWTPCRSAARVASRRRHSQGKRPANVARVRPSPMPVFPRDRRRIGLNHGPLPGQARCARSLLRTSAGRQFLGPVRSLARCCRHPRSPKH